MIDGRVQVRVRARELKRKVFAEPTHFVHLRHVAQVAVQVEQQRVLVGREHNVCDVLLHVRERLQLQMLLQIKRTQSTCIRGPEVNLKSV